MSFLHLQIFLIYILCAESKHISLNLLYSCISSFQNIKSVHCLTSHKAMQLITVIIIHYHQFGKSIKISRVDFIIQLLNDKYEVPQAYIPWFSHYKIYCVFAYYNSSFAIKQNIIHL